MERRSKNSNLTQTSVDFLSGLHAIAMAVQVIRELEGEQFVIMSDSCSVLKSLRCVRNQHSICRKSKHKIAQFK